MTPADIAAIEARVRIASGTVQDWQVDAAIAEVATEDAPALLAHIRTKDAEREAEIAAAVAKERERALEEAAEHFDGGEMPWYESAATIIRNMKAAIREPKP